MSQNSLATLAATVQAAPNGAQTHQDPSVISPDLTMVLLTWVTFFLLLAVLYKFAWKPILNALDAREENIRRSLEDAQKAREELAKVNATSQQIISQADEKAKEIVERSRKAAMEAARVIENKAKEEAGIVLGNATAELGALQQKAKVMLRQESVEVAVQLASKILGENLDQDKHQKLIDEFLKDFKPEHYEKS